MSYAVGTTVSPEKSRAEIEALLRVEFLKVTGAMKSTDFLPSPEEEEFDAAPRPRKLGTGGR